MKVVPPHHASGRILLSWPLLISIVVLLGNDWWLKSAYPGLLSGKLSDFAGVALVGMLAMAAWPQRRFALSLTIAATFLWWKSPLSQPAIELANAAVPFRVGRTIDYTDLLALCVLPLCSHVVSCVNKYSLNGERVRCAVAFPVIAAAAFAIMGTSVIPTRDAYSVRGASASASLQREKVAEAIAEVMQQQGLECRDCSKPAEGAKYSGRAVTLSYTFQGSEAVSFQIEAWPSGFFFGASGKETADALRTALKSLLAERFTGLEYVEPLKSRRDQWK